MRHGYPHTGGLSDRHLTRINDNLHLRGEICQIQAEEHLDTDSNDLAEDK